jgi:tetratricopeptide (TPR) repeat protein
MRSALPHALLLVSFLLLLPILMTGGGAAPAAGASQAASGQASEPHPPSVPLFPDLTFAGQTPAAQDWYAQGFTLTNEGRYSEALIAYGNALSLNRSLLNAWYYSGDALFRLGRYQEALLAFENATAADPDFVDAYFYESLIYHRLGRSQDEKEALGRGLLAADRKNAKEGAGVPPPEGTPGAVPQPVSAAIPFLGAGLAAGLRRLIRRNRVREA